MIYYGLGFITSSIVFSFFLVALRAPVSNQFLWAAAFSLMLLSGAAALIFLIGLILHMATEARQHRQITERTSLSMGRSEAAAPPWPQQYNATYEARDIRRSGQQLLYRAETEAHKHTPQIPTPMATLPPGFENINRH